MRKFLRRLSIFIILLSFVFLGGGAVVSYIENGSILPETYLIGLSDSDVSISTVDNEGVKGFSSGKDTNDNNNNNNVNSNTNNIINNDNSNNNNNQNIDNNQTNEIPVDENVPVEEGTNTEIVDGTVPGEEVIVDENDTLRKNIENKFGISIKYGTETEGYKVDTLSTVSMTDKSEIKKALLDMEATISLFPEDLFWELKNNGYPLTIYLIKN